MLTRYRVQLMGDRTREAIRLELMLEDASIKLSAVASSADHGLGAGDAGGDDRRGTRPAGAGRAGQGADAVEDPGPGRGAGRALRRPPRPAGRAILHRLDLVEQALAELDAVIAATCAPWAHQIELLQTIPGVGPKVAQVIIAETGADMSRFPTAAHLAAWAGVAPAIHESAGQAHPGRDAGTATSG